MEGNQNAIQCEELNGVEKNHITELKSMMNPPEPVKQVLSAVQCLTKNQFKKYEWIDIKKSLADPGYLNYLKALEIEKLSLDVVAKVKKTYLEADFWDGKKFNQVSLAASKLAKWVEAVVNAKEKV